MPGWRRLRKGEACAVCGSGAEDSLAIEFTKFRDQLETDLVGCVLCDPARGIPVANAAGIIPQLIEQEDLRLIYCAADIWADKPIGDVVRLARLALESDGYWTSIATPGSTGFLWSEETLWAFAESWPHCAGVIQYYARRLIDAVAREREIADLRSRIAGLLSGDVSPVLRSAKSMQIVLKIPRTNHKVA